MERPVERNSPDAFAGPLQGARILVVEDDFFISMELEAVLSEAGAAVRVCRTAEDALASVKKEAPSVGVLDFRMAAGTTEAVARRLHLQRVPFAFYTGQAEVAPLRAAWPECAIVSKPARPQALIRALAELLGRL